MSGYAVSKFETVRIKLIVVGTRGFGELVHGEGAYINQLVGTRFSKTKIWRLEENIDRHGNLFTQCTVLARYVS